MSDRRIDLNETEISHGRVSWQTYCSSLRNGAVGFIDWLDGQGRQLDLRSPEAFK